MYAQNVHSVVVSTEIFYVVNNFKYLVKIHATQLTVNQLKQNNINLTIHYISNKN